MGKSKKQVSPKTEKPKNEKFTKSLRQKGGVYFYCGAIMGRKNVFVTDEYINLLVNAFKMAELRKDVKNLGYVIMPNFFYWMFRLSEKNDNPVDVYKDVKKQVALEILQNNGHAFGAQRRQTEPLGLLVRQKHAQRCQRQIINGLARRFRAPEQIFWKSRHI